MTPRDHLGFFRAQLPIWVVLPFLGLAFLLGMGGGFVVGTGNSLAWAGPFAPAATQCPESSEVCANFRVFWQAWDLASRNFVEPEAVVPARMTEGAINGMLATLGDEGHTRFLSAEAAEQWAESISGSFEGIGAYIDVRDGQALIVAPIEGSPAEAAGLLPGDVILKVDGQPADNWTVEELAANVRGPRGTTVLLTILHEGDTSPVDIEVRRDKVEIPSVSWTMLPNNVAFVRLNSFAERSAEEVERALERARAEGAQSLVFDLRDNPGGLVREAVGVAGQFLPEGTPVLLEENRAGERTPSKTNHEGAAQDLPMVVLVNNNTASSAEIVSGALQDASRASVIGVATTGTGTVLSTYKLEGGAQLLLGTSQWLTPQGRLIRNQGITPNVEVALGVGVQQLVPNDAAELSAEELAESEDAQLLEALNHLPVVGQR